MPSMARATIQPMAGDTIVIYTDGVIECEGPGRALLGEEQFAKVLSTHRRHGASQLLANVVRELDSFRGEVPMSDDLSLMIVRRL